MIGRLESLTPQERDILALLAEGHSVKSAAMALGISEHAAEERLRSARRKTGASSSRELARTLKATNAETSRPTRKIRAGTSGMDTPTSPAKGWPAFHLAGAIAMIGLVITASAALLTAPSAPKAAPRVVSTSPAQGAAIPAGPFTLTVRFDQEMKAGSYSFVTTDKGRYPDCAKVPTRSPDGRNFTLACTARAGESYAVGFNGGRFRNFVSARGGVAAEPFVLRFSARP